MFFTFSRMICSSPYETPPEFLAQLVSVLELRVLLWLECRREELSLAGEAWELKSLRERGALAGLVCMAVNNNGVEGSKYVCSIDLLVEGLELEMADAQREQQMKEQIALYMRKKDYYDILGLPRTCDEAEIKKAYKKLALRFHPDKNRVEGSKEVFKKVSNAYSTLSDAEKRASYDRYGPEEDRAPQFQPQRRQYRQGYSQEDEFEEIFRAFFGGGGNPRYQNNQHFQHYTFNMGGGRAQNQQGQQNHSSFLYFFIFIIVLYVVPAFMGNDKPYHSFKSSSVYRFKVKSSLLETPYFVREEFFKQGEINAAMLKSIEEKVDTQYLIKLKRECDNSTWMRNKYAYQAKQYAGTAYEATYRAQAAGVDTSSCNRFHYLQDKHPDYIKDLFYYY